MMNDSDSEEEVFGVGSGSDDSDEDKSDIALSDVEGQDDKDDLPDVRAWGTDKRKFYSTDYVDPDYGGFLGKDAQLAELEEEEARNLQRQLAQQLDDDDFSLDVSTNKQEAKAAEQTSEEIIKSDISQLSKRQKLQILEKESPEFFGLVEDFQNKMKIVRDFLAPVLKRHKEGKLPDSQSVEFVQTQYELILNYCVNICMYLLLKASRINVQNHPVIKRLYQHRQLLSQLLPVYEEVVKPQIEAILAEDTDQEVPKKTLNVLKKLMEKCESNTKKTKAKPAEGEKPSKKVKFDDEIVGEEEEKQTETAEDQDVDKNESGKRAITYQIAKNKGLTPHRKKEQRNPRVKHRNKFRKAKIRRKGAVREPRTEMKRYGGEISGIKASVSKSIKIK